MFIREIAQASAFAGTLAISLWASAASGQSQPPVEDGSSAARANAENPRNLRKLHFTEVENTAEYRLKYPFIEVAFKEIREAKGTREAKVSVAEMKDENIGDVFLEFVVGPTFCGAANCEFNGYARTKDGFRTVLEAVVTPQPIYLQTCPDETSLVWFAGLRNPEPIVQWVYTAKGFEFKASYPSMKAVPACGADTNAGAPGVKTGALTVYGEPLKVSPCSTGIPDSTFAWKDVKGYLPPEILRSPKAPMSHEQILAALEELSKKSGVLVAKEIIQFVPIYKVANRDDKNDPFMELVDAFNGDRGADALPGVDPEKIKATEKHNKEAIALTCVYYAMIGKLPQ